MTDAERLKVAEEMIAAFCQKATLLSDISLGWSHTEPHYHTQRLHVTPRHRMGVGEFLSVSNDPIEAVILARQKLAAEREAAMTPEVRRLRDRVTRIRNYVQNGGDWDKTIITLCDEALEES